MQPAPPPPPLKGKRLFFQMVGPFYEFVDESVLQKFNITRPQPQECWAFIDYRTWVSFGFRSRKPTVWFGSFKIVRVASGSDVVHSRGLLFRDGVPYIGTDRNIVCLWRRHNCNWSLSFCGDLLIYEINYWGLNNSDWHAIISILLIINLHWVWKIIFLY